MLPFVYLLAAAGATADTPPITMPPPPSPRIYYPVAPPPPPPAPWPSPGKAATPKVNPGSWVTSDDYPSAAIRNMEEGRSSFRLEIDKGGKVSNCMITASSGSALLDATVCEKITSRARFQPALDQKGKATAGSYSSSVRWVLPDDGGYMGIPVPEDGVELTSMRIDEYGFVTHCRTRDMRDKSNPWKPCADAVEYFEPYRDKEGTAVPVRIIKSTSYNVVVVEDDADQ